MKKLLFFITVMAVAVISVGCTSTPVNESSATKIFDTVKGEVEIPVEPMRIVSDYYLGELLAVGVKPIVASPYSLSNPFLADKIDGIESLNVASAATSLEMITAAEPDLIITLSEADYDTFSKIAPTVLIPYGQYTPEELFYYIADMVGKKSEAEAYMSAFKKEATDTKDEIQSIVSDRTVSFVEIWPNEIYVFGKNFGRGGSILFDLWGLKAPEKVEDEMVNGDKQYETVSLELISEYTGDFLFYGILENTDSSFVEDSTVWQLLPPVQNGLVQPYEQVAFMHSDPISLKAQLDYYLDYFRGVEQ